MPARAYHLAEAANLPSIERHGLLSASCLLGLAGIGADERARRERTHRSEREVLADGIVVRDQKPMSPALLESCLIGATPAEWYALLNSKVFFWFDAGRLGRLANTYRPIPMVVLVVDTARLLARHAARAAVTPINTGNARPFKGHPAAMRGRATFVPHATWLDSGWASERAGLGLPPRATAPRPAELVIEGGVPDVMELVVEVRPITSADV